MRGNKTARTAYFTSCSPSFAFPLTDFDGDGDGDGDEGGGEGMDDSGGGLGGFKLDKGEEDCEEWVGGWDSVT